MSKFLKRLPAKLWMIVCAAITHAFFANDFGLNRLAPRES